MTYYMNEVLLHGLITFPLCSRIWIFPLIEYFCKQAKLTHRYHIYMYKSELQKLKKPHKQKSQTTKLEYLYCLKYKITQINSQITPGQILHTVCITLAPTDLQKKHALLELLFLIKRAGLLHTASKQNKAALEKLP